jgi:hypothetical protein
MPRAKYWGLGSFDEDDLYAGWVDLCSRQEKIEPELFQGYLRRKAAPPRLFFYDVPGSYWLQPRRQKGEITNRRRAADRRRRRTAGGASVWGNTADPMTVSEQIPMIQKKFQVHQWVCGRSGDG